MPLSFWKALALAAWLILVLVPIRAVAQDLATPAVATTTDKVSAVGSIAAVVVSVVTAVIVYWQTQKLAKVNAFIAMQESLNTLNDLTLDMTPQDPRHAEETCILRFNHFYTVQRFRNEGLVADEDCRAHLSYLKWAMHEPNMVAVWERNKGMYSASLGRTIAETLRGS